MGWATRVPPAYQDGCPSPLKSTATGWRAGDHGCTTPSNPAGTVYSQDELKAVIEWARDKNVWVIADEIYRCINFADDKGTPAVRGCRPPAYIRDGRPSAP